MKNLITSIYKMVGVATCEHDRSAPKSQFYPENPVKSSLGYGNENTGEFFKYFFGISMSFVDKVLMLIFSKFGNNIRGIYGGLIVKKLKKFEKSDFAVAVRSFQIFFFDFFFMR